MLCITNAWIKQMPESYFDFPFSSIQGINGDSLRLCVTKWWISSFISRGYTEVHIWLPLESILLAQHWCMWAKLWQWTWMMTWGSDLEEHWHRVSWETSICSWWSFHTSPNAAVRGEPKINEGEASWSCLFLTLQLATCSSRHITQYCAKAEHPHQLGCFNGHSTAIVWIVGEMQLNATWISTEHASARLRGFRNNVKFWCEYKRHCTRGLVSLQ